MTFNLIKQVAIRALLSNQITTEDVHELFQDESATIYDANEVYLKNATKPNPLTFAMIALKSQFTLRQRLLLAKSMLYLSEKSNEKAYQTIWNLVSDDKNEFKSRIQVTI